MSCADLESFVRGDLTLTTFSFNDQIITISGQCVRWRADAGPTLNAGFVACDFSGDPNQCC